MFNRLFNAFRSSNATAIRVETQPTIAYTPATTDELPNQLPAHRVRNGADNARGFAASHGRREPPEHERNLEIESLVTECRARHRIAETSPVGLIDWDKFQVDFEVRDEDSEWIVKGYGRDMADLRRALEGIDKKTDRKINDVRLEAYVNIKKAEKPQSPDQEKQVRKETAKTIPERIFSGEKARNMRADRLARRKKLFIKRNEKLCVERAIATLKKSLAQTERELDSARAEEIRKACLGVLAINPEYHGLMTPVHELVRLISPKAIADFDRLALKTQRPVVPQDPPTVFSSLPEEYRSTDPDSGAEMGLLKLERIMSRPGNVADPVTQNEPMSSEEINTIRFLTGTKLRDIDFSDDK